MLGGSATSLEVRVDGKVDAYERAIRRAETATRSYDRSIERLAADVDKLEKEINDEATRKLEAQHAAYSKMGAGMVVAGGGMLAGAALSARAAMQWESAWAGVTKTTSGSAAQMGVLEGDLRRLATTLPASHEEIAGVAEAAGQLGVARQDIAAFTKVAIDLGETTNLSAEEAATGLAQMMNVMGTAPDKIDELGSTLVDLGNHGASTEAEILAMAQRITGAAKVIGASETDVLGLASAMADLGIQSELGGGAIQRVLLIMQQAVQNGDVSALSRIAGVSAHEFAEAWRRDPVAALDTFVQGMGRVNASGGNLIGMLGDAQIKGTQNLQVMLRLAGAGDHLSKSLGISERAWRQNNALIVEANKRYGTTESQMRVARNQINDVAITIGSSLLPVLSHMAGFVGGVANAFAALPGPVKSIIGPATAVLGLITLVGGAFLLAVPKIAAFNAAMTEGNLSANMVRTGNAAKGLSSFLMGPWGIAMAVGATAIMGLAAGSGEAKQRIQALQSTLDEKTGDATAESLDRILSDLQDQGWDDFANKIGVSMDDVARAALYGGDALDKVRRAVDAHKDSLGFWGSQMDLATSDHRQFLGAIEAEHDALGGAKVNLKSTADTTRELGLKQKGAADDTQDMKNAMQEEKSAAEQLQNAIEALNSAILGSRGSARDYQQTLDDTNKELREGRKTLNIHTKAGRDNQAALDAVAESTIKWSDSLKDVDATGRKSWEVLKQGREDLFKTARRFGMTEKAAHDYVDRVLSIPTEWKTEFETPGAHKAQGEARETKKRVEDIPKTWLTIPEFKAERAQRDAAGFKEYVNRQLDNIHDEPVNITLTAQAQKVERQLGNISKLAKGGPVSGPGGPTDDSIAARLSNGEHVITADEVRKAGGHSVIEAFRRAALRGELPRETRMPRHGELPAFAAGGPVVISPNPREIGVMSSVGSISALARAIANAQSRKLSAAASKAYTAAPLGGLGPGGHLTPGQIVRGQQFAQRQVGKPYIWGGVGPAGYDCSGAISAVTNAALGRHPYSRLGSTGTMPWPGWNLGVGKETAGWFTGSPGHTAGRIGGLGFESAGGVGFRTGRSARSPMIFPRQMSLRDDGGMLRHGDAALNLSGDTEEVLNGSQRRSLQATQREIASLGRVIRRSVLVGAAAPATGGDSELAREVAALRRAVQELPSRVERGTAAGAQRGVEARNREGAQRRRLGG